MFRTLQMPFANRSYYWVNEWSFDGVRFWINRFSTGYHVERKFRSAFDVWDLGLVEPHIRVVEPLKISVNKLCPINGNEVSTPCGEAFLRKRFEDEKNPEKVFERLWNSGSRYLFKFTSENETPAYESARMSIERINTESLRGGTLWRFDPSDFRKIREAFEIWSFEIERKRRAEKSAKTKATNFFQLANAAAKLQAA